MNAGTVVILLGPPGSGKGTQAVRLSADLGVPHMSTGDLFRMQLVEGTELGRKAQEYMDAGKLVPDELVTKMLFDRVAQDDCASGYLLDGFPRTLPQARSLDEALDGRFQADAFLLDVPDAVLVERAAGRLICGSCGRIHHERFDPPRASGVCDSCGKQALYRREDDAPDVVRDRLAVYRGQTHRLIDFYRGRNRLVEIDGDRPMEDVYSELIARVGKAAG